MEEYEYQEVFENENKNKIEENMTRITWKPLLRQCMICFGVWCIYLVQGLYLGAPTVIVAQIRKDVNSTELITDEMLSWITSMTMISGIPFIITLSWLYNKIGRKYCFVILWMLLITGTIIFYMSTSIYHILIGEVFFGANTGAVLTFVPLLISEYTSPKYRGIFLTLKSATIFWGIWISNVIGTFFHWKNIALFPLLCPIYVITVFLWPESPSWLAKKGRYEECAKSHRWLKGVNKNSEKELMQLINFAKEEAQLSSTNETKTFSVWSTITSRPFYKPILICLLLHGQYIFSGKMIISLYAIQALKRLVTEESIAYKQMLILDGITVFSMYIGCIFSRYFKRRTLMLVFSCAAVVLLYILSLYVYIVYLGILQENHVVILVLLCVFSITIGVGPMILATSMCGEFIPSRYQSTSMIFVGLGAITTMAILLKISPFMFANLKMHGCFLFFAITSTFFCIINYFLLPETKDKTMQEIEKYFYENKPLVKTNDPRRLI